MTPAVQRCNGDICTGQLVQRAHERSQQPLDMPTHMRLRHRPLLEHDAVLLARPAQHIAVKFLGVSR
jgi:hypothetical protein